MRFIGSIVRPGSGVRRHDRRVSIAGTERRGEIHTHTHTERQSERERERAAIQSTLNFWMLLRSCESHRSIGPVSSLHPAVSRDTLDVLYPSAGIRGGHFCPVFFVGSPASLSLSFSSFFSCSPHSSHSIVVPSHQLTLINFPVFLSPPRDLPPPPSCSSV